MTKIGSPALCSEFWVFALDGVSPLSRTFAGESRVRAPEEQVPRE
jgi:hypothetical protein